MAASSSYELEQVNIFPLGNVNDNTVTCFVLPSEQSSYYCLSKTDVFITLRVVNNDGSHLSPDAKVAPSPAFYCTLFEFAKVFVNEVGGVFSVAFFMDISQQACPQCVYFQILQVQIGPNHAMLPVVQFLKALANYSSETVQTYLQRCGLFTTDISELAHIIARIRFASFVFPLMPPTHACTPPCFQCLETKFIKQTSAQTVAGDLSKAAGIQRQLCATKNNASSRVRCIF